VVQSGDIVVVVPKELLKNSFQATTQAQGKGGGRKGRVRVSITIPTLVIISYSKACIWG
jgi:hypothetical protein